MRYLSEIVIHSERRMCEVNGRHGYFHCFEHYSNTIPGSDKIMSRVFGVVEFANMTGKGCVERVEIENIRFTDEENRFLQGIENHKEQCEVLQNERNYDNQ